MMEKQEQVEKEPSFAEGTLPKIFTKEEVKEYNNRPIEKPAIEQKQPKQGTSTPTTEKRQEEPIREVKKEVKQPVAQPEQKKEVVQQPKEEPKPQPTPKPVTPKPEPQPKPAPVEQSQYNDVYVISAYTNRAEEQTTGITANGEKTVEGRTIACPPALPFGTKVEIEGLGSNYVCTDRGSAIQGKRIDVFMESLDAALSFGMQSRKVKISK